MSLIGWLIGGSKDIAASYAQPHCITITIIG